MSWGILVSEHLQVNRMTERRKTITYNMGYMEALDVIVLTAGKKNNNQASPMFI